MTTPKRLTRTYLALTAGLLVLFGMNLLWGSVSLTPQAVLAALLGKGQDALSMGIILQLRLPRAVMVILLGAALSVAGYLLQTFFANPIAGPFVMGISSGGQAGRGPHHGDVPAIRGAGHQLGGAHHSGGLCGCAWRRWPLCWLVARRVQQYDAFWSSAAS